jgi:hypothetical protein
MYVSCSQVCRRLSRVSNRICRHLGGAERDRRLQRLRHAANFRPHHTRHGLSVRSHLSQFTCIARGQYCAPALHSKLILNMGSFAGASPTGTPLPAAYSGSKTFLRAWPVAITAELTPRYRARKHILCFTSPLFLGFSV